MGRLQALLVTRRDGNGVWGGRVERVVLDGNAGRVALTGDDIRWRYGLRSPPRMQRKHGTQPGVGRTKPQPCLCSSTGLTGAQPS